MKKMMRPNVPLPQALHPLGKGVRLLLLLLLAFPALAQPAADSPEMADALRQDGKFWVVVGVFVVVMVGMFAYLLRLEGKVRKLEERTGKKL